MKVSWLLACLGFACTCHAQTSQPFVGAWTVTWDGAKRPQQARLVITESGGTWQTAGFSRTDGCVGREVPIAFDDVNGNEARVKLKFSEAIHGCIDATIHIRKLDEKTMTGSRGKAELTIVRD